jgi:hypothetical protein
MLTLFLLGSYPHNCLKIPALKIVVVFQDVVPPVSLPPLGLTPIAGFMSSSAAGLVHAWRHVWNMEVSMHVILSSRARPCLEACLEHGGQYACHPQQLGSSMSGGMFGTWRSVCMSSSAAGLVHV